MSILTPRHFLCGILAALVIFASVDPALARGTLATGGESIASEAATDAGSLSGGDAPAVSESSPLLPEGVEEAARISGIATDVLSTDFSAETLQSTRQVTSASKRCSTFYLMYTRSEDVAKALTSLFDADISAGDLKITDNPVTNSILVRVKEPNPDLLGEVSDVIRSLDFRSGQVLIDVLVVDVTVTDTDLFNFEIKSLIQNPLGGKDTLLNTSVDHGTIDKNDPTSITDGFKAFVTSQNKLKLFLNAAKKRDNIRVISSPHIVAANHRKATFKIGEKIPLISSIRPSDAGPIKSFDIKEVGLELEVTPHINRGGQIDVEILQRINAVQSYDPKEGTARMSNREADTNLCINDGETIVLGGFVEDRRSRTERKTPLLSDIPLLGKAFTSHDKTGDKTELMVFLTPRILDTKEDARQATLKARARLTDRDRLAQIMKERGFREEPSATQTILIDRRSRDWEYQIDTPATDILCWQVPPQLDPASLSLPLHGSCPFGFGSSKRLNPLFVQTYLKPSDGAVFRKSFTVADPGEFTSLTLHVASNNAAAVYLNGTLVDEDPMMKLKDGHDFEYWNRTRDDVPASLLKPGLNTIVVLLANDKTTSDGFLDMMLKGNR